MEASGWYIARFSALPLCGRRETVTQASDRRAEDSEWLVPVDGFLTGNPGESSMVLHTCVPSTRETEGGGGW